MLLCLHLKSQLTCFVSLRPTSSLGLLRQVTKILCVHVCAQYISIVVAASVRRCRAVCHVQSPACCTWLRLAPIKFAVAIRSTSYTNL